MAVRPTRVLTYEDYVRFPDDGRRFELIDGEAFVVPSPDVRHQDIAFRLARQIDRHLEQHGGGRLFVAPLDVLLSDTDVVQPDVIFVSDARSHIIEEKNIRGAPTWVIEVVSDPVRDQKVKRDLYLNAGIEEYWAVVSVPGQVEIYQPRLRSSTVKPPARPRPVCLPALEIDLETILAD